MSKINKKLIDDAQLRLSPENKAYINKLIQEYRAAYQQFLDLPNTISESILMAAEAELKNASKPKRKRALKK
jgi:hypothetical protein